MIGPPHPVPAPQDELLPVAGEVVVTAGTDPPDRPPADNPPPGVPDRTALPAGAVELLNWAIAPVETSAKTPAIATKVELLLIIVSFVSEDVTDGASPWFKSQATRCREAPVRHDASAP